MTRSTRIFAISRGSSGIAGARGVTALSAASRSIPIKSRRSIAPMRRPRPRSRMRAKSSPPSTPIPAPERWGRRQDGRHSASEGGAQNSGVDLTASFVSRSGGQLTIVRSEARRPQNGVLDSFSNMCMSNSASGRIQVRLALRPVKDAARTLYKRGSRRPLFHRAGAGRMLTGRKPTYRGHAMADEALFGLLRQTADLAVVRALKTSVEKDPDRALNRINPLAYAKAHGLDEEQTIGAFVHAARLGLFDMSWNMLCPSCGGVIETGAALKTLNHIPLLLLVLHRRLRAHARQAGRGDVHGQSSNSPHRRARSGFASLRRIHAPDLLELEQRVPGRCRKRGPKGHARHDGARRGRKGGDVAQRPERALRSSSSRSPILRCFSRSTARRPRSGATCRLSSPTRIPTAAR